MALALPAIAQDPIPPGRDPRRRLSGPEALLPLRRPQLPTNVYWGDTHLHTGMSMDAGAFGARLQPDDAYEFAKGQELTSSTGLR